MNRRWVAGGVSAGLIFVLLVGVAAQYMCNEAPAPFDDDLEHFKYGSIGAEVDGYPFLVWRELPTLFAREIPQGWETFGFIQEPAHTLPIGISVRRYGIDRVGFNCATCHTTGEPMLIPGAPADQLDLQRYLRFLIWSSQNARFTAEEIFRAADANQRPFGWLDRQVFRFLIIPQIKAKLVAYENGDDAWMRQRPDHGPGRTDAGNPWRVKFGLQPERDALTGAVDIPSLWNQRIREHTWMHWDGNNGSLTERNLSAALAGGASEDSLDHSSIERVAMWSMDLPSPRYPYPISESLAAEGQPLYAQQCAVCHDIGGANFGEVTPLMELGTDADRVNLFSSEMVAAFSNVGKGRPWQFTHYRKTEGYANSPLDGIWARAPYLHNGSVPTLQDLLLPPLQRPRSFFKGCGHFDPVRVGRVCTSGFTFETRLRGNSNLGHEWGTRLDAAQRRALLEYLKTL